MRKFFFHPLMFLAMALAISSSAFAADPKPGEGKPETKYAKTTEFSFEDDTIEGDLTKPDGEYIEARKAVKHSNLIRIRESFKEKILQSVGEL